MSKLEVSTANEIRRAYIDIMSEKQGKRYTLADRYRSTQAWRNAAVNCIRLKADPRVYVMAQFASAHTSKVCYPQTLGGEWAIKNYEIYVTTHGLKKIIAESDNSPGANVNMSAVVSDEIIEQQLEQLRSIMVQLYNHCNVQSEHARQILAVPAYAFDDWFRVCLFPSDPTIWEFYGKNAFDSLVQNGEIREACRRRGWAVDAIIEGCREKRSAPWDAQSARYPYEDSRVMVTKNER